MSTQSRTKASKEEADKKRVLNFWKAQDPKTVTSAEVRPTAHLNTPSQNPDAAVSASVDPTMTTNNGHPQQLPLPQSYREHSPSRQRGSVHQHPPLLVRNTGQTGYVPWGHRDLETLVASLPPLKRGANLWVRRMEELTANDRLSLGEVRALLVRAEGTAKLAQVEAMADTAHRADADSFNSHRGRFWQALRDIWPTKLDTSALIGMEKKAGEEMYLYLQRAEEGWHEHTGGRHDRDEGTTWLWRRRVQEGLPQPVQAALKEVVGLGDMEDAMWRAHLVHHDQRHWAKKASSEEEIRMLTLQLLRLQVAQANEKKQEAKMQKRATEAKAPQQAPNTQPGAPADPYQPYPVAPAQPEFRYQWGYGPSHDPGSRENCYTCGQKGHWSRTCPRR
ncbi:uncharacterized protein LOC119194658 [Pungitius pungitius]|uniref:uncharacterized protein LOC119194658 n=1 Tax=Pungitius pungitius TaxID=134920 RepID=UPI002E1645C1